MLESGNKMKRSFGGRKFLSRQGSFSTSGFPALFSHSTSASAHFRGFKNEET